MLLGSKKTQGSDQSWFVVLNRLASEIEKRKVANKLSGIFSLSGEEAVDLVNSTPIILLDNLTKEIADQVERYFKSFGAILTLSNDLIFKRKCYRTVWPEPPSLHFLKDWKEEAAPVFSEAEEPLPELLDPEEALNEIRSLNREREKTFREFPAERLSDLEPLPNEQLSASEAIPGAGEDFQSQKRHQDLREEYEDAKNLFEQKVKELQEENHLLKKTLEEKEMQLRNGHAHEDVERLKQEVREWRSAAEKAKADRSIVPLQFDASSVDIHGRLSSLERKVDAFLQGFSSYEAHMVELIGKIEGRQEQLVWMEQEISEKKQRIDEKAAQENLRQIASRLGDKENHLKRLVQDQQSIEKEIRQREETMRKLLAEQETVEKEILDVKRMRQQLLPSKPLLS